MTARWAPAACFAGVAAALVLAWLVVSSLGWVDALTVLTGDGEASDLPRAALVLAAWFGAVLGAPALALAAVLDLAVPALWRRCVPGVPEGRRRNQ
jgi:hypothetical protein